VSLDSGQKHSFHTTHFLNNWWRLLKPVKR
jgi:hypothetical protein